jgi:hypothetical protein
MVDTYTFTARNADNPDEVVTLTIRDDFLYVSMTGFLEQVNKVKQSEEKGEEIFRQIRTQAKPIMLKLVESLSGPVHVSDTNATLLGERLVLSVWKRVARFRLLPVVVIINRVDNPEASEAFVAELNERKRVAGHIGKFFGPLDYWFGWIGVILLLLLLVRWPQKNL